MRTLFARRRIAFARCGRAPDCVHVLMISQGGSMRRFLTSIVHASLVAAGCAASAGCDTASEQRAAPEHTGHTAQAVTGSDSWVVIPAYYYAGSDTKWNQLLNANWGATFVIVIVTG